MSDRETWQDVRDRRMREPGASEAYEHARLAYELGREVRGLRELRGRGGGGGVPDLTVDPSRGD